MNREKKIQGQRRRRAMRVRKRFAGSTERPRLTVFRSHRHIYAQLVDDERGHTLVAASSRTVCGPYGGNVEHAKQVGAEIARKALEADIKSVCFDRGAYRFHGRVKALAEAAREKGLDF